MHYYTGIGSRSTPKEICATMCELARGLVRLGYTVRSGGAGGADTAFSNGAGEYSQIFIPWNGFNELHECSWVHAGVCSAALDLAAQFHPAWNRCSQGARKLHARNCYQVLGQDLNTPSEFVLCWTPGGSGTGGTGQALRIAEAYGIPVFDLGRRDGMATFLYYLKEN